MSKGFPDWFTGTLLHAKDGDVLRPSLCDTDGYLTALLKSYFGTTPVTIQCDADGFIKMNIQVSVAEIEVKPSVPPQNIPVDITAQSLTPLSVNYKYLSGVSFRDVPEVASGATTTIFTLTGPLFLQYLSFQCIPNGTWGTSFFRITVDGGTMSPFAPYAMFGSGAGLDTTLPLDILWYGGSPLLVNVALRFPVFISDSLLIAFTNGGDASIDVRYNYHYFPL